MGRYVLVVLLLGSSCVANAQEIPIEVRKDAELVFDYVSELGRVASAHAGDCSAMGAAVQQWLDKNPERVLRAREAMRRLESLPSDKQTLLQSNFERPLEQLIEMVMLMSECMEAPGVKAGFEPLIGIQTAGPQTQLPQPVAPSQAKAEPGPECRAFRARIEHLCAKGAEVDASLCEGLQTSWGAMNEAMSSQPELTNVYEESCKSVVDALVDVEKLFAR